MPMPATAPAERPEGSGELVGRGLVVDVVVEPDGGVERTVAGVVVDERPKVVFDASRLICITYVQRVWGKERTGPKLRVSLT